VRKVPRWFVVVLLSLGCGWCAARFLQDGGWRASSPGLTASARELTGGKPTSTYAQTVPTLTPLLLEVQGMTQAAPGHHAIIAPVVQHPVVEVLVALGDRVKKDQPLVKLDDDEPRADVRAKKAALIELKAGVARLRAQPREYERAEMEATLEGARIAGKEARRVLLRLEDLWLAGALPEQRYHEAKASALKAEADEHAARARLQQILKRPLALEVAEGEARVAAAQANLEGAQAELEHYTPTAPLAGVVSRLDVTLGTVSRPGTSVWGEILDLSELDVRCGLAPAQVAAVAVGQAAEVSWEHDLARGWTGRVTFVGPAADPATGRVPVLVRIANPQERLRCGVAVQVRFNRGDRGASP
jgi:multidrug resistance efflux pump